MVVRNAETRDAVLAKLEGREGSGILTLAEFNEQQQIHDTGQRLVGVGVHAWFASSNGEYVLPVVRRTGELHSGKYTTPAGRLAGTPSQMMLLEANEELMYVVTLHDQERVIAFSPTANPGNLEEVAQLKANFLKELDQSYEHENEQHRGNDGYVPLTAPNLGVLPVKAVAFSECDTVQTGQGVTIETFVGDERVDTLTGVHAFQEGSTLELRKILVIPPEFGTLTRVADGEPMFHRETAIFSLNQFLEKGKSDELVPALQRYYELLRK